MKIISIENYLLVADQFSIEPSIWSQFLNLLFPNLKTAAQDIGNGYGQVTQCILETAGLAKSIFHLDWAAASDGSPNSTMCFFDGSPYMHPTQTTRVADKFLKKDGAF